MSGQFATAMVQPTSAFSIGPAAAFLGFLVGNLFGSPAAPSEVPDTHE